MNTHKALAIVNGAIRASSADIVNAYQTLITSRDVWTLPGNIGREAQRMIRAGLCHIPGDRQPDHDWEHGAFVAPGFTDPTTSSTRAA